MSLPTDRLDYELPAELIATRPAEPRDAARLLVVGRSDPARLQHAQVSDLPAHLEAGDALVLNTTAVAPARFLGRRAPGGGRVEGLLVEPAGDDRWIVMLRCNGRLRRGGRIELLDEAAPGPCIELIEPHPEGWIVACEAPGGLPSVLERLGRTPLPPYVRRARAASGEAAAIPDRLDRAWYGTVYADSSRRGSVAAPTAGLHFTPLLLQRLADRGVRRIDVTLHVGPGTFRPITAADLGGHVMHGEAWEVPAASIAALREVRAAGGRIIAVGSTAVRTLESLPDPLPHPAEPLRGRTDLLIAPPWRFRLTDGMLTNFHLPRSTLLALVAALLGLDRVHAVYREAIRQRYRFYSYGDAMLILP